MDQTRPEAPPREKRGLWGGFPVTAVASLIVLSGGMAAVGQWGMAIVGIVWFAMWYGIFYAVTSDHTVAGAAMTLWYGIPAAILLWAFWFHY